MSEITISLRYAKALLDLAKEQNKVEEINSDVKLFQQTVKANPQLRAVLADPIIHNDNKLKILHGLFAGKVNEVLLNFFDLMIVKGRGENLYFTAKQFGELYNQLKGILKAEVVSATALTEESKKTIVANLEKEFGKQVELTAKVDADLIGGFVLTVGDRQYDASIAKQLKELKKKLTTNSVVAY